MKRNVQRYFRREGKTWIHRASFARQPLGSCLNGLQRYSREEGVGGDCNMNMTENLFDFASFKTGQTKIDSSQNLFYESMKQRRSSDNHFQIAHSLNCSANQQKRRLNSFVDKRWILPTKKN